MAYPVIYNVTYSYTGFQQAQGNSSFPGTQIDADLAGLRASVSNLALFVQGVMRSDGVLQNNSVTYDSLSTALQTAGMAPAAAWATATAYLLGNTVVINSKLYRLRVAHTSGVFATDLAAGNWLYVADLLTGPAGQSFREGAGVPANGLGNDGDTYLNITTSDVYTRAAGAWSLVGNVRGIQGIQGVQGIQGGPGPVGAAGTAITFGLSYATLAALNADLGPAANAGATVQADGANNGLYQKVGASGAGSWTRISTFSFTSIDTRATETERRAWLDLRNSKVRLGTIGDSIYQGDHAASSVFVTTQNRPVSWALGLYPHVDYDVWYDAANTRNYAGLDNCFSGSLVGSGAQNSILQLPNLLPYQPDITLDESGINSVTVTNPDIPAATIIAQKTTIATTCLNAGVKKHIMRTITPIGPNASNWMYDPFTVTISLASPGVVTKAAHGRVVNEPVVLSTTGALLTGLVAGVQYYVATVIDADHFTLSATPGGAAINTSGAQSGVHTATDPRRQKLLDVNTWIRSYATTTPNVILFDAYAIYDDGTGHPKANYTVDGLHPTSLGSQHEASDAGGLVSVLQKCVRPLPQRRTPDGINLSSNIKNAAGGTLGTGVSGNVSAGFTARMNSGGATTTVVANISTRSNGDPYQQLDFTTHSGVDPAEVFAFLPTGAIDLTAYAGRWIRARCRLTVTPGTIIRGITVQAGFVGIMNPIATDTMINQTWVLDLESPPFKLGVSPGSIAPFLWAYINGTPALATASIQVDDFSVVNVDNAMYLHNTLGG